MGSHTSSDLSFAPSRVPKHFQPPAQLSSSSSKRASTSKGITATHTSPKSTHIVSLPKPIPGLTTNDAASTPSNFCNLCRRPIPNTSRYVRCDTCRAKHRAFHQEYRKRAQEKKQAMKIPVAKHSASDILSNGLVFGELPMHAPVVKKHNSKETPIQQALQSSQASALVHTRHYRDHPSSSKSRPKPTPSNVQEGGSGSTPSEKVLGKRKAIAEVDFKQVSKRNKPSKTTSFKPILEGVYQTASQLFSEMCSRLKVASAGPMNHYFEGCYSIVADPSISLQGRTERVHWTLYERYRFPVALQAISSMHRGSGGNEEYQSIYRCHCRAPDPHLLPDPAAHSGDSSGGCKGGIRILCRIDRSHPFLMGQKIIVTWFEK